MLTSRTEMEIFWRMKTRSRRDGKKSFETLLNVENEREELEPTDPVQGPIP